MLEKLKTGSQFVLRDGRLISISKLSLAWRNVIGPSYRNLDVQVELRREGNNLTATLAEKDWLSRDVISRLQCGIASN